MLRLIRRSWNGQTDQAIWTCVFLITLIGVVVIVPFAQSDPPGPGGDPEIAQSIRRAVAFGPCSTTSATVMGAKCSIAWASRARDAIEVLLAAEIQLSIHNGRCGVEALIERIGG